MLKKKSLIVIASPSGGGKSTVARFILDKFKMIQFSVSATTRAKRTGERNGVHYFYLTLEEFESKIKNNEFVEFETFFGNYYGTLKSEIDSAIGSGKILLFDVDVKGAFSLQKAYPEDTLLIFLAPPSLDTLKERLKKRETENEEQINIRLARAEMEMSEKDKFDFVIVNEILSDTFLAVEALIEKLCK
ncbi:MAG: guanylate kinase [Candidatus Kapabacteria bacterium]|nr:guanylate kinase [Candidatus Kapabacteria bacterium]